MAVHLAEMDERVTFREQLGQDTGPVVLINRFNVAPDEAELSLAGVGRGRRFHEAAAWLHLHPATPWNRRKHDVRQLAAWESAQALAQAFGSPEFQARAARYPDSAVATPHVFEKVAVLGICLS